MYKLTGYYLKACKAKNRFKKLNIVISFPKRSYDTYFY